MLEVKNIRTGYGGVEVLRGIDLSVASGEIVAVLGANGVGKTTLNKALSGLLSLTSGSIIFDGRELAGSPIAAVEAGLIHVPEGRKIFPNMSVHENLELGSYRRGRAGRARNIERVYETFPKLRQRTTQMAGTLSGGEQQMLAIGRGMMAEPKLLILDEPSLGLSPLLVEEMFDLVKRLNGEGLPIMLVEQNVVQSLEIAHRAYIIENGQVTMSGSAAEISGNPELKRAYLGL
ncbi:ABC transporter ATP-binding protein [Rhizobium sp. CSW-27]|uniref:ABC transporter ATP-binding protein n=1 Tax=Rhizobium sp. CSW-27 TaxID=2839985 RepID=UPI001C00BC0F|nr:ABC transporter ATP-binding protein [Rhizobium sp. CSW-27]MBT9369963.1 ABC transporter ATP-binding protein [Rhizobium sp. CSW-27]